MHDIHTTNEASFDAFSSWYTTFRCKSMKKSYNKKVFSQFFFTKIKKKWQKGANVMFEYQKMAISQLEIAICILLCKGVERMVLVATDVLQEARPDECLDEALGCALCESEETLDVGTTKEGICL